MATYQVIALEPRTITRTKPDARDLSEKETVVLPAGRVVFTSCAKDIADRLVAKNEAQFGQRYEVRQVTPHTATEEGQT